MDERNAVYSTDHVRGALATMLEALVDHANKLNRLDAAIGDGDMGVTVRIGAQAVLETLGNPSDADLATLLSRAGMAFNRAAASTTGALLATAGMRAGKVAKDENAVTMDLPLLARMVAAAETGIRERGKAQRGDKTLLDALIPASEALTQAANEGVGLREAGRRALIAAQCGCEETVAMRSRIGRAGWIGERTIGQPDPGATAVVIALQSLVGQSSRLEGQGGGDAEG
jgi:dihydroxyacetone kinase-like protein